MPPRVFPRRAGGDGERGLALVTAIAAAVVISITAAVVLNLTFQRFELSVFRTDHAVAVASSEAGLQYVFARMEREPAFRTAVQNKTINAGTPTPYVVTCHAAAAPNEDEVDDALHMGNKHVTVEITFFRPQDNPPDPNRPYQVEGRADFGTGLP